MKTLLPAALLAALATPAMGQDAVISFADANTFFPAALGKQVDIRFAPDFAKAHFDKTDFDAVVVSELPEGKVCFFGKDQGLDPDAEKLKDIGRPDQGDVCVPAAAVSVRFAPQPAEGAPPVPFYATDKKACSWSWIKGKDIGLWAERCTLGNGTWSVAYDAKNDWFTLNTNDSAPYPVLRQFHKKAEDPPDALLPSLRKAGLIPDDDECKFQPSEASNPPKGWSLWEIVPVGKRKEAFDALPDDEVPDPPCGELGYAVNYIGFFMIPEAHKDRMIHVDLGQDGTMFDPFSVTVY